MAVFGYGEPPDDSRVLAGLADERSLARTADLSFIEHASAFDGLGRILRSTGEWAAPQPWLMTFVPGSSAEQVARTVIADLDPQDLGEHGQVTFYPLTTEAIGTPLVRIPDEQVMFVLNLVRFATGGATELPRLHRQNRAAYDWVRAAGGKIYPVSALGLSRDEWKQHYGPAWPRALAAKQSFDPANCLTPGYEMFQPNRQE